MNDRSWLLNPHAIRAAKKCIQCVQIELDIKLKLSHPDFMQMLHEYVELTESPDLGFAYAELLSFVGVGNTITKLKSSRIIQEKEPKKTKMVANGGNMRQSATPTNETVIYSGKSYPLWRDGKRFKGVYRGQPNYA